MLIDCDSCAMRDIACSDCVMTMLLAGPGQLAANGNGNGPDHGAGQRVDLDEDEQRAVDVLAGAGLIAPLRLVPLYRPANDPTPATAAKPAQRRSIA